MEYDEFGHAHILIEEIEFNPRFPGQYYDKETGLNYNYYRDYDPDLGRYVQSDPRGVLLDFSDPQRQVAKKLGVSTPLHGSTHLNHTYNYADGNPVMKIDPTGEAAFCLIPGVGWVICGAAVEAAVSACGYVASAVTGTLLGGMLANEISNEEPAPDRKNCDTLKQSVLNTCYGLKGKKRMECFNSANSLWRQCMGYE